MPTCARCGSPRIHLAQDWPHGDKFPRCRNCGYDQRLTHDGPDAA